MSEVAAVTFEFLVKRVPVGGIKLEVVFLEKVL